MPGLATVSLLIGSALMTPSSVAQPLNSASPLTGTTWELVAIQSMDDAQGTTRIGEPERFRLHFSPDGAAQFLLDCNRGTATWQATTAAERTSGSLVFGPLATTRMMCPTGSLDQRWVTAVPYVRSYLIQEGRLYLSLMADGGIYEWRPANRESHRSR
jgi:heat shock protein HslJ